MVGSADVTVENKRHVFWLALIIVLFLLADID